MKKLFVIFAVFAALGMVSAQMCDVPGSSCNETDWSMPNPSGGYGGFDGETCQDVALVVAPGNCDGSDDWASVDMDDGIVKLVVTSDPTTWNYCDGYGHLAINWIEKDNDLLSVRYLDGYDQDSFDVYFNDVFVCSIEAEGGAKEEWKTAECMIESNIPAPEFATLALALAAVFAGPGFALFAAKRRE